MPAISGFPAQNYEPYQPPVRDASSSVPYQGLSHESAEDLGSPAFEDFEIEDAQGFLEMLMKY
jgi:hypothetical protein